MCDPIHVPPANQGPGTPGGAAPGGAAPGGAALAERRARRLLTYMEKICALLGLTDGSVWTTIHDRRPGAIGVSSKSAFKTDRDQGPPPPPQVMRGSGWSARSYTPQPYYPNMIKWLLWRRLRRLLKHCKLRYGSILFEIEEGKIVIRLTDVFRPKLDDISELAKWF